MIVWYRSRTLWALVVSAIAHTLALLGIDEGEATAAATELVAALAPVVGLIADAVGLWGRTRATGKLTLTHDETRLS